MANRTSTRPGGATETPLDGIIDVAIKSDPKERSVHIVVEDMNGARVAIMADPENAEKLAGWILAAARRARGELTS